VVRMFADPSWGFVVQVAVFNARITNDLPQTYGGNRGNCCRWNIKAIHRFGRLFVGSYSVDELRALELEFVRVGG
jgi:hypothetical protein